MPNSFSEVVAVSGSRGDVGDPGFVSSSSPAMRALEDVVSTVAGGHTPVLVLGERGTGKRTLALQVHRLSGQASHGFRHVVCAELSADVLHKDSPLLCSPGTLFLEEVADLTAASQPKLLHAFFDSESGNGKAPVVRLIASSRRNLEQEIRAGRFREDLYYRISGVCLRVPPLRHRKEDIPLLVDHFLGRYSVLFGRSKPAVSPAMMRFLLEYAWPGNIGELENAIKTLIAVGDERVAMAAVRAGGLDSRYRNGNGEALSLKETARAASRQAERELILKVLSRTRWNRKRAAQELKISYKALLYKLKQIGLDDDFIGPEEMTI